MAGCLNSTYNYNLTYVGFLVACAFAFQLLEGVSAGDVENQRSLYAARQGKCDYFVSVDGKDSNDGTDLESPFESLKCACDAECNTHLQRDEVICLLSGTHNVYDTIFLKGDRLRDGSISIMALGKDRSVILDAEGQGSIFNALQTHITFTGIVFANGGGTSGGAAYGERGLKFVNCLFEGNTATVHGGAVMGGRLMEFYQCDFIDNSAKFAGAVRVNDIGSAIFEGCTFIGNTGEMRGGAIATQIEKPDQHSVVIKNTLFCFNESPMSPHIYNYRTDTHECKECRFNSKHCCNLHGRVVPIEDADSYVIPEGKSRSRVCECDAGWTGERCEINSGNSINQSDEL